MTGNSTVDENQSRMLQHREIEYGWRGEVPPQHSDQCDRAFIGVLANRLSSRQVAVGNLPLRNRESYERRTRAFIRQRMDRVREGRAFPCSEVKTVELAADQNLPVFELRWNRTVDLLDENKRRELIRQYCAEPESMSDWVYGLVIHFKNIDGLTAEEIRAEQDTYINEAIDRYRQNERMGWSMTSIS